MNHKDSFKISGMMFFYYFSMGLIVPIFTQYLSGKGYLNLSASEAGSISGLQGFAAIVAPLLGIFITDRLISAERLFAVLQIGAAFAIIVFSFVQSFIPVLLIFALYEFLFIPGIALTNTIAFHYSVDGGLSFGGVRKWGTLGWIFSGLFILAAKYVLPVFSIRYIFLFSGFFSFLLGCFVLFFFKPGELVVVPSGSTACQSKFWAQLKRYFPSSAFKIIFSREILLIILISLIVKLVDKYYYYGCAPFLKFQGIDESLITALMGLGQVSEVIVFIFLGKLIQRLGYRKILLAGILSEAIRFFILAYSTSIWSTALAFPFHGLAYAFFSGTAYIFINKKTDRSSRAGVQHFYALITGFVGIYLGGLLPGIIVGNQSIEEFSSYWLFWFIPAILSLVVSFLVLFLKSVKADQEG